MNNHLLSLTPRSFGLALNEAEASREPVSNHTLADRQVEWVEGEPSGIGMVSEALL